MGGNVYPEDLKYNETHQWVKQENGKARIGITFYAQKELGDIVLIELPKVGTIVEQGRSFGVVESTKSASEVFSPVNGKVTEVNEEIKNSPEIINKNPYGKGWIIKMEPQDKEELRGLLTSQAYQGALPKE